MANSNTLQLMPEHYLDVPCSPARPSPNPAPTYPVHYVSPSGAVHHLTEEAYAQLRQPVRRILGIALPPKNHTPSFTY
jgi:hypothetical protein